MRGKLALVGQDQSAGSLQGYQGGFDHPRRATNEQGRFQDVEIRVRFSQPCGVRRGVPIDGPPHRQSRHEREDEQEEVKSQKLRAPEIKRVKRVRS
jgi:hypothetical protein